MSYASGFRPDRQTLIVLQQIKLVCPRCALRRPYSLAARVPVHEVKCQICVARFTVRLVQVHAIEARPAALGRQSVNVLVHTVFGAEERIDFSCPAPTLFQLRPGDMAVFTHWRGRMVAVQNLTLDRHLSL